MLSAMLSSVSPPSFSAPPPAANIRVYVRVRPASTREKESNGTGQPCLTVHTQRRTIEIHSKPEPKTFTYEHVADEESTQEEVFQKVGKPITDSCMAGYNGTIFAYGQTGSGKTHTLQGYSDDKSLASVSGGRGLMPRVFEYLMASIAKEERRPTTNGQGRVQYTVSCSFIEIYNEKIFDLLDPTTSSLGSLQLHEDRQRGVFVDGVSSQPITSARDAEEAMKRGASNRRIGETALNRESSRSHSVFTLDIRSVTTGAGRTIEKHARFNLIDLAGSERAKDTGAQGQRMAEAKNINRSLSALGNVIRELMKRGQQQQSNTPADQSSSSHIPYRDSRLTFLLRDSLGGNSLTYLVACVSSSPASFFETLSTLKFATMASAVKNCAKVNEDATASIEALKEENQRLKEHMARLMAQQTLGARRLSMMPTMGMGGAGGLLSTISAATSVGPGAYARESCIGLLSPSRLRQLAHSRVSSIGCSGNDTSLTHGSNTNGSGSAAEWSALLEQAHSREQTWLGEIETYKSQIAILEQKQRIDGMRMKLKEREIERITKMNENPPADGDASELALLREELELLKFHHSSVTHAPSLVRAWEENQILRDQLAKHNLDPDSTVNSDSATSKDKVVPSHRSCHLLQSRVIELQHEVSTIRSESVATSEAALAQLQTECDQRESELLDSMQAVQEQLAKEKATVTSLEAKFTAERDMVTHLESQLIHLTDACTAKDREHSESLLLKHGQYLRLDHEREQLLRRVSEFESRLAKDRAELTKSSEVATATVTAKMMEQINMQQANIDAHTKQMAVLESSLFESQQSLSLIQLQKSDLEQDLRKSLDKSNELEREASKERAALTQRCTELEAQVTTSDASLVEANKSIASLTNELSLASSALNTMQEELSALTRTNVQLQTNFDKSSFALDTLQDDHDTLTNQFDYQTSMLEVSKLSETKMNQTIQTQIYEIEQLTLKIHTQEGQLQSVRDELRTMRADRSLEESLNSLLGEKATLEARLEEAEEEARHSNDAKEKLELLVADRDKKLHSLSDDLASAHSLSSELKSMVETLSSKVGELNTNLERSRMDSNQLARELDDASLGIEASATRMGELEGKVMELETTIEEANHRVNQLHQLSTEAQHKNHELTQSLGVESLHKAELSKELESLKSSLATLQLELDAAKCLNVALESDKSELATNNSLLESDKLRLESSHSSLTIRISTLEHDNRQLESNLAEYVSKATSLDASIKQGSIAHEVAAKEIETARDTIRTLESVHGELHDTIHALETRLKLSDERIRVLETDLSAATHQARTSQAAFDDIQKTIDSLESLKHHRESEMGMLKSANEKLSKDLNHLKLERDETNKKIGTMESELESLRSDLTSAQSAAELSARDDSILIDLQTELTVVQEQLRASLEERELWIHEMETCRREESKAIQAANEAELNLTRATETLVEVRKELERAHIQVSQLESTNATLTGHQNQKQKIQLHMQIKKENESLRIDKSNLEREVKKLRKLATLQNPAAASGGQENLDKELAKADEHIRQGEQAQVQLKTIMERIAELEVKLRSTTSEATTGVLGDITNTAAAAVAGTVGVVPDGSKSLVVPSSCDPSFPVSLSTLSTFGSTVTRLAHQLDQARRELKEIRNQIRLQQMKDNLATHKMQQQQQQQTQQQQQQEI